MNKFKQRYIGDWAFYRQTLVIALPILVQNVITNFVNMLDNIMVGRVGTLPMSGVSIMNQLMFVFNLCLFGAVSGAGIFTAQFAGKEDNEGIRHTMRFKLQISGILTIIGLTVLLWKGAALASLYLTGEGTPEDRAATLAYGLSYLRIMLVGLVPFAISNSYASTLREIGESAVPMRAGIAAMLTNLCLNYILIFGHFGAPEMGVRGAALATVISRFVELTINACWLHTHTGKHPFAKGLYRTLALPLGLYKEIALRGLPLMLNETLWSAGLAVMNACYSTRGLMVVAAQNISSTVWNLFSVCFLTMGVVVGIIIGQMLGARRSKEEVRDANRKLTAFAILICLFFAVLLAAFSGVFPRLYNTSEEVRSMATSMILICAAMMPFNAYTNAAYFTLRSGGKVWITILFDSVFVWVVNVPLALILANLTAMPILPMYAILQSTDILKTFLGAAFVRSDSWMVDITTAGQTGGSAE